MPNKEELKNLFNSLVTKNQKEALNFLGKYLPIKIQDECIEDYGKLIEMYCHFVRLQHPKQQAIKIIGNLIEKDFNLNGENYWYFFEKGLLLQQTKHKTLMAKLISYFTTNKGGGNKLIAENLLCLAAFKAKGFNLFHITRGLLIYRPAWFCKKILNSKETSKSLNKINFSINTKISKVILITCADSIYFKKYAEIFYHSALQYGTNDTSVMCIHFHIINPDEECYKILKKLNLANFSTEIINLSEYVKKPYYTIQRYTIIPELKQCYEKIESCIVNDIDIVFNNNIISFANGLNTFDAALTFSNPEKLAVEWNCIGAALSYFKYNDKVLKMLCFYQRYILEVFDFNLTMEHSNWLIDQMALFKAYDLFKENLKIKAIKRNSLIVTAQSHPGGKSKFIQDYRKIFALD